MPTSPHRLIAAAFTPMDEAAALALDRVPLLVDQLIADGVDGLFILGSTGEGASCTTAEREEVAEAYVRAAAGRLPVIVHVGHESLREARRLAAHAARLGADAIAALPPSYFRPETAEDVADCLEEIAGGAPDLPLYYYHIPALTGVDIDVELLLRCAGPRIPSLCGVKFSDPRLHDLRRCKRVRRNSGDPFEVLFGVDDMLADGLAAGADGAVGSTYNFAAPLYRQLIEALNTGDREEANRLQGQAIRMLDALFGACGRAGLKATMGLVGVDCGPHRLPLRTASAAEVEALQEALSQIGFYEWARQAQPA